jgi:hypothetical protein
MLPGLPPLSPINLLLTVIGFVGGALLWNVAASHSGIWERLRYETEAANVKRLLSRQMAITVAVTAVIWVLSIVLGSGPLGGLLSWLTAVGGMIFWAYLGAMALTAWRGAQMRR